MIRAEAGWMPRFTDLHSIVKTAYDWRLAHPYGYDDKIAPKIARYATAIPLHAELIASEWRKPRLGERVATRI
jgi:hypothetical protein